MAIFKAETTINVPFYDNDPMGVVWHGNYVKYLEIARCDTLAKIGYDYMDMKNDGVMYPIAKLDMKYIKPSKFAQNLRMVTVIEELEPSLIIKYEIFDENDEKIFKGKSMQICVNIETKQSVYVAPQRFKELLNV